MFSCGINPSSKKLSIADMLDTDCSSRKIWNKEELQAIFRHQLSVSVEFDLVKYDKGIAGRIATVTDSNKLLIKSLNDLFFHPSPPIELLVMAKQFAKALAIHPDSPLPKEIADVLYFESIAVALLKCKTKITRLEDKALCAGMQWAISQTWIDEKTRVIFRDCLKFLESGEDSSDV